MGDHYFSADPAVAAEARTVSFTVGSRTYTLTSSTGVFSGDRLDPGTSVLLRAVPRSGRGTFLDLGCGYGPLACVLATEVAGADVWAVDVNARALELTRANAQALGVSDRVHVRTPDQVPSELRFDQIWSNPPIRIGKSVLHELLQTWLCRLADDGVAWLVVGKFLGSDSLQRWLNEDWRCERHASAKGYRVLSVRRPTAG